MSIKLMSAIFETEMRDLEYIKDGEVRKAKASTVKLVLLALSDHANDYGESSYPGYDHLEIKTALSRQGISDTLDALKHNGLLTVNVRSSRLGTNDYTINIRAFPPMYKEVETLPEVVKPLDSSKSSHLTTESQATGLEPSINHQVNHQGKLPKDEGKDLVDGHLELSQSPGIKRQIRIDSILSYLGGKLRINTETKRWKDFARFVDDRQQVHHEPLEVFISWVTGQKNFDVQFWPPSKMEEMWPQAFLAAAEETQSEYKTL